MALNSNKLAAVWLCYVTNDFYRQKLERPIEEILLDDNFLTVTGLDEDHIRAVHERVYLKDVSAKIATAREAFHEVFLPTGATALWESSSPATYLIAQLATAIDED